MEEVEIEPETVEEKENVTKFLKKEQSIYKKRIVFTKKHLIKISYIIIIISLKLCVYKINEININRDSNENIIKIEELVTKFDDKIFLKKEPLKYINSFVACIGKPGVGKSTFANNYYKQLYGTKINYFMVSNGSESCTKSIWTLSENERRKIPEYIKKDFIDVEGFQIDSDSSWKYAMIVAFLSTDLIILNEGPRFEEVKKMIKIVEIGLKKMKKLKITRILKVIYIQATKKSNLKIPIEELLETFKYNKTVFKNIKFKYIYLPKIDTEEDEEKDLMDYPKYKKSFQEILKQLNINNDYSSVASLLELIDSFNNALNDNTEFNVQEMIEKIKINFNAVYSKHEVQLKEELMQKIPYLIKLDNLNETFEDFIKKQKNLKFNFEINNDEFSNYGSGDSYDDYYENLRKNRSFRIEPKEIFMNFYETEILRLKSEKNKNQHEIYNVYLKKKFEIDNYFSLLKFYQDIKDMDFQLNIKTKEIEYKLERENDLKNYFHEKVKEKKKDWESQIERAKWKTPVQAYGEMECINGHKHVSDNVVCSKCKEIIYWVDSDSKYVICPKCNRVFQMTEKLSCLQCGAESKSKVKWIKGYKP